MIVDAHVHAWEKWPWKPEKDGSAQRLLDELDRAGVARAIVICAGLNGNDANNEYVVAQSADAEGRLIAFADIDSRWSAHHGQPGIGRRVEDAVEQWGIRGVSHYLREDEDADWLAGPLGIDLAESLSRCGIVLSIAALPRHMPALAAFARHRPDIPILLHHMGGIRSDSPDFAGQVERIAAMAIHPNLVLKISGFPHVAPSAAFPFEAVEWLAETFHRAFGASRLVWGSDFPVVERTMTYADALETTRLHYAFLSSDEQELLFGGNMLRLLNF